MGMCGYGGGGISVRMFGTGAGNQEGQRGETYLSGHPAVDPFGFGLRSDHHGPHRALPQDALASAEGALGLCAGPSATHHHHLPRPGRNLL